MTTPSGDRQSEAYRGATDADHWDGDLEELTATGQARAHAPAASERGILLPEFYERHYQQGAGWDTGREGPKSLAEAREALAARIADPHAPDDESVAGAYDWDED